MQLQSLHVRRFTAFKDVTLEFSPGFNVLIGANSTGKSHMLKLLYSAMKSGEQMSVEAPANTPKATALAPLLRAKLAGVFKPQDRECGRLVRRAVGRGSAAVEILGRDSELSFTLSSLGKLSVSKFSAPPLRRSIFIPSRETLAIFEGFIAAYQGRELAFDETYYDLCVALSASPLRGPSSGRASALMRPLEKILGGKVKMDGNRFYVWTPEGNMEAHLVAEGYRKLAELVHLVANGSLMQNGILFWDEPEANLNPNLVTVVKNALAGLASMGVQVFLATHDYLLTRELSLAVEYPQRSVATRFFCLRREEPTGPVEVECGERLADLEHNPILQEFIEHYDRERSLFYGKGHPEGHTHA